MSNLLEKSSLVLTPTAYDNGKILSVKPTDGIGDFDFTRNSSATRVNSEGLIEDVQILSSNLVSNGDFSQEGSELITNGGFDTDLSDWTYSSGVTWNNGKAEVDALDGSFKYIEQIITSSGTKTYKISFEISNIQGSVQLTEGTSLVTEKSTNGTFEVYYKTTTTNPAIQFKRKFGTNTFFELDNVSVKEVGQNWILGSGITIEENKAIFTSTASGQSVSQNAVASSLTNGALAKVSFEVLTRTEGSFGVYFSGTLVGTLSSAGVFTAYFTKGTETSFYIRALGTTSGSISNISVIEITDDTNLPRINYTDGVGSWLFEPQSTNLIITSDSGVYGNNPGSEILTTSPDGTNTAVRPIPDSFSDRYTGQISGGTYATNTKITYSWYRKRISTPVIDTYVGDLQPNVLVNVTQVGSTIQVKSDINGFDRFSATFNISDGSLDSNIRLYFGEIIGIGNSSVAYWGHQLEVGSFATSIIPTSGSTVTRLADAAFGAGSSDLINSTEGVLYAEISALANDLTFRFISISDGTTANRVFIGYQNTSNNFYVLAGTAFAFISHTITDITKIAIKYKSGDTSIFINGIKAAVKTDTYTLNGLNSLQFDSGGGGSKFYGNVKCVAVFKEALTDEELTCLTTI